ncbi:MAG: YndJ family protein [Myxococcales bacterium]|nr:YndJ family protein [Myxococcales bacterium]
MSAARPAAEGAREKTSRFALFSAVVGAISGAAFALAPVLPFAQIDLIEKLLVLGPLVGIPLGLSLASHGTLGSGDQRALAALVRLQPVLALTVVASVLAPRGATALSVTAPWLLFCGAVSLLGGYRAIQRFRAAKSLRDPRFAIDAALMYLAVGGAWHALARGGMRPLGFDDAIVRLTAVHFHFAGWVAPLFAARVAIALESPNASDRARRVASIVLGIVVLGPGLVGGGITVSQVTSTRVVELVTAVILAAALLVLGGLTVSAARREVRSSAARGLLNASSTTLALTMALAVAYAWSRVTHGSWPTIPFMARYHGVFNAVGYALFGLAGWAVEDATSTRNQEA